MHAPGSGCIVQQHAAQMTGAAQAERRERNPLRLCSHGFDQVGQRLVRRIASDHDGHRGKADPGDGREILDRVIDRGIIRQILRQIVADGPKQHRIAIGARTRHFGRGDNAARAGTRLDHERRLQTLRQSVRDESRDRVRGGPHRSGAHQPNGPGGPGCGKRGFPSHARGRRRGLEQYSPTDHVRLLFFFVSFRAKTRAAPQKTQPPKYPRVSAPSPRTRAPGFR
ncbi:Uncharacterised protein [Bordetella pertussis]|nr:Uncharacterised protein [Bordetella pertussis]CPM26600.1 Uncharacterised protein [Bordetella pertussis]